MISMAFIGFLLMGLVSGKRRGLTDVLEKDCLFQVSDVMVLTSLLSGQALYADAASTVIVMKKSPSGFSHWRISLHCHQQC